MEKFYITPDITPYSGIIVKKETELEYKAEDVEQVIKDLTMVTKLTEKGDEYDSKSVIHIYLKEGDILLFDEKKGYFKPGIKMQTAKEIAEDFSNL